MAILKKENYNFEDLKEIVRVLRSESGCPWDREQTHKSMRNNFIEEVYEAVEAIDENRPELLKEELGDVLVQIVMHANISEEAGGFDIDGVCDEICKKLILRHPHVFGETPAAGADTPEQVLANWEEIKIKEKGLENTREYLESTAKSLPALIRAEKIYKRAVKRGVSEPADISGKLEQLSEDIKNMKNAADFGRILFDVAALASELDISSEQALYDYNEQLIRTIYQKNDKL